VTSEHRERLNRTDLCESFVQRSQDAFIALRHDGTIEFASAALRPLLGYDPESVVGRDVVDWLKGDDAERALVQLGESMSHLTRGVTRFAVEASDGTYVPIEVAASVVSDGEHELIGLCCRDGRDQALIEGVMSLMLEGVPREEAIAPVLDTIAWEAMGSKVAIDWSDADGRHLLTSGDLDAVLCGLDPAEAGDDADDPWTRSRRSLQGQRGAAADEGGWLLGIAADWGVDSYWVEPVFWSAQYPPATVTVWTTTEHPSDVHAYGIGVARRLLELILRWTEHVPPVGGAAPEAG
jgi:PAS domain S-box-containing protein